MLSVLWLLLGGYAVPSLADETTPPPSTSTVFSNASAQPTFMPSPVPSMFPTFSPTMTPSIICEPSVCLIGKDEDPECCSRRDRNAECSGSHKYRRGDACGVDDTVFPAETLFRTCCLYFDDGSDGEDDLSSAEELIVILCFSITSVILICLLLRFVYVFISSGCRCQDFGAMGSSTYYDERRGQCFGLIAFVTFFSFLTLLFAWLAAGEEPDMLEAFGFGRIQTTKSNTFLVVGLSGYAVFSKETSRKGLYFTYDDDYGKDDDFGNSQDFDWTGGCQTAGTNAQNTLIVLGLTKIACCFFLWRRQNPNTDNACSKLIAALLEFMSFWFVVGTLAGFGLRCLMALPTQKIFLPDEDAEYSYDTVDEEMGEKYKILFVIPYTSYLCLVLSGLFSLYISWVHLRMPTWDAELHEKSYY